MSDNKRLYDAFGELIYAVAMADGEIQKEEREALEKILKNHLWSREIRWSFNYEDKMGTTIEESYQKALDVMKANGPDPEYQFLFHALSEVALSSNYIDKDEENLIARFKKDLQEQFLSDYDKGKWNSR